MMYWGNGMGGWGMVLMTVSSLLVWGLIIAGIVTLVRYTGHVPRPGAPAGYRRTPRQVLADRFAQGEIDEDEYIRRLRVLDESGNP